MTILTPKEAASILGISKATLTNWIRAGDICAYQDKPLKLKRADVLKLKASIGSTSTRLQRGSNKAGASNTFLPSEYAEDGGYSIAPVLEFVKTEALDTETVLYIAALKMFAKEVKFKKFEDIKFKRKAVRSTLSIWKPNLKKRSISKLFELIEPSGDDYLGLLYQSIFNEGRKSEQGSYYTPTDLVQDSFKGIKGIKKFLDPCCGTGKYLVCAAKYFNLEPQNVWGFDIDLIAVTIAKLNLLMLYLDVDFEPNIQQMDTLSELGTTKLFSTTRHLLKTFDMVATNPPWGAYKNTKINVLSCVQSGETFSYFIERGLQLLKSGGKFSFILPKSVLNVKAHSDIRKFMLKYTIKNIVLLGRPFTNVFSEVVRIDIVKTEPDDDSQIHIFGKRHFLVTQSRFVSNKDQVFDVDIDKDDEALIAKIYSIEHKTLKGNAKWALGIVTGDNDKHVGLKGKNTEPVLRGTDVKRFRLLKPKSHLTFDPSKFQQVATIDLYRAEEKLVYKAISSKLCFAYDRKQRLTLNSANIVIPAIDGISIKVALAFLNSTVFQYLFKKKFNAIKVLRHSLESFPFPVLMPKIHDKIEYLVSLILVGEPVQRKLNALIYKSFKLTADEIQHIEDTL